MFHCPIIGEVNGVRQHLCWLYIRLMGSSWVSEIDFFSDEVSRFERDVHLLILGTLNASIRYMDEQVKTELADIEKAISDAINPDYQQHLAEEHADVLALNVDQETFLRNMALVALATRLTHALRYMARSSETFVERKKRYGTRGMSEFDCLWAEFAERFGIDFTQHAEKIDFVNTLRNVRNQIVHDGGEANPFKPLAESELDAGDEGMFDLSFSKEFNDYVHGTGCGAEVCVSQEQLEWHIAKATTLVKWLAEEFRRVQLALSKELRSIQ